MTRRVLAAKLGRTRLRSAVSLWCSRPGSSLVLVFALLGVCWFGQSEGLAGGRYQVPQVRERVLIQEEFGVVQAFGQAIEVPDQQIDGWVFRQDGSAENARRRLDSLVILQVDEIDRTCRLSPEQKKKIILMGRGDIKRFFDRVEQLKEKVHSSKLTNSRINEVLQETNPLAASLQTGLFQKDSLLQKSIAATLSADQAVRYEDAVRRRQQFRHLAGIKLLVTQLEQTAPLPDAQRQKLIALLTEEIKPVRISGIYDSYYLMWQLGRVPEEKLKPLFDAVQWKIVDRFVNQYKGVEQMLRQAGYIPNVNDEAEKTDDQ